MSDKEFIEYLLDVVIRRVIRGDDIDFDELDKELKKRGSSLDEAIPY